MPTTNLVLYPGSTFDLTFGGSGFPWEQAPTPAKINDAANDPVDPTYGFARPAFAVGRDFYAEYRLANIPIGIVSIASLRLCAWLMSTGTAGTYDTAVSGMTRPEGSGGGASGDYYTTPITHTSQNAAAELYTLLEFAPWTLNPFTSAPWTKSELAVAAFGIRFQVPATDPVLNPSIKLGRLFAIIEATSIAADTGAVRTAGSTVLWQLCRAREPVRVRGPIDLADVGLMEMFSMTHPRGRRPGGPGWGRKPWERGALLAMEKSVDPMTHVVTLEAEDRRSRLVRYWLPGLTNVGHSLDGQGLPILHSGGGPPVVDRNQVKYIERPGNPTDHVLNGVTEDLLAHDQRGMAVEAFDDTNLVINSTFSQGSGDAFDSWTAVTSGSGTVTEELARIGVDETGFRRSVFLNVGVTDASDAAIAQDVSVSGAFRLGIRTFNNFGADRLSVTIQRGSDSEFFRDSDQTWHAAVQPNRIGNDDGGYRDWASKEIDPGGADTITVAVGYFGEAGSVLDGLGYQAVVWSVDLCEGVDHIGTPIITTTGAVARIGDIVRIPNNAVGRWWSFDLGGFSWSMGGIPLWNGEDLDAGAIRILLHVDHGTGGYSQIGYQRGAGEVPDRFFFSISSGGGFTAFYPVADDPTRQPLRNRVVKVAGYWIGPLGELDLPVGEINIAVDDEWGTPDLVDSGVPEMAPVSTGYLGHAFSGVSEVEGSPLAWWNGFVRQVRILPLVLRPEELQRNPR